MRLVMVRHGATVNNIERRFTGHSDVPLSPLGLRQAEALATALAGERFDLILSSDLVRARQTAEPIARRNNAPLRLDADLREIAVGTWEGLTRAETAETDPDGLARWRAQPELYAPLGGETVLQLRDRAVRALNRCFAEHPEGRVLLVTHGGLMGVLFCHLLRIELTHRWQFRRDNAALTTVDIGVDMSPPTGPEPRLYAIIMHLNDTCHLKGVEDPESTEPSQVL